jgi:hypothetical protein
LPHEDTNVADAIATIEAMKGVGLVVPSTEDIWVSTDPTFLTANAIHGYRQVATCRAKVSASLNPRLALLVFISRMTSLAERLGPNALIFIAEEDQELGPVTTISPSFKAFLLALALVESPLWLFWWLSREAYWVVRSFERRPPRGGRRKP